MIPLIFFNIIKDAESLIKIGQKDRAIQILDSLYEDMSDIINISDNVSKMEMLGAISVGYRKANATEKAIPVLERLCKIAVADINQLGIIASSEDIRKTATDLLILGVMYIKMNRRLEARKTLVKAEELFNEIDWELNVNQMLESREICYIGDRKLKNDVFEGAKRAKNLENIAVKGELVPLNFEGQLFYLYFPEMKKAMTQMPEDEEFYQLKKKGKICPFRGKSGNCTPLHPSDSRRKCSWEANGGFHEQYEDCFGYMIPMAQFYKDETGKDMLKEIFEKIKNEKKE